jgi:Ca-activated chloride channel homolog
MSRRRRAPRVFLGIPLLLGLGIPLAVGLWVIALAGSARGSESKPQVTNGGYMQTVVDGQSVPLPLRHTDVKGEISGFVASVQVTQHFGNPYKKPIEAVYVFPLPHRSAVYDMTIQVGKRTIKGVVKKRVEARQIYDRAKAQGKTAALLEQERPNIFTQSIANIMPGDDIKVAIRYVEDLMPQDGRYEFAFPMVVGPRYVGGGEALPGKSGAGWGKDTTRIPDASRITPHLLGKGLRPGNDIALSLKINAGVKIQHVQVVAHRAKVNNTGSWAEVVLDKSDSIPNKDFVVRYQLAGAAPAVTILPHRDAQRGGHFLLMIQPKAKMSAADIAPREYIFVIDKSGSQSGFPIEQSKAAVRKCLANVGPRDTFNLIAFESGVGVYAPRAVPATKANLESALSWINTLSGGGGTEFIPALRVALKAAKDPSRSRIVLFMTDGYIGYERQVLQYLRENAKGVNLFPLGVGSSVNRFLIDGMARIGVGTSFYLLNTEKPAAVVERIFSTISKPALTSITVDWGGLDVEQMTPSTVPDLFGQQPVFVAGRYRKGGKGVVTVRGRLAGKPYAQRVAVELPTAPTTDSGKNLAVAYLWARRQIADWSDLEAIDPAQKKQTEGSITTTALRYNLMSQYTSFVAVDQVVRNQGGKQTTVEVPVPLPDGVSEKAAPNSAYVGAPAPMAAAPTKSMSYGGGYRAVAADESAARPRVMAKMARQPMADPYGETRGETRRGRKSRSAAHGTKQVVSLSGGLQISGASRAVIEPRLRALVAALAPRLSGQSGTLALRLTLDKSGGVARVTFVSGTLLRSPLKAELERLIKAWRFGPLPGESTLHFTLQL